MGTNYYRKPILTKERKDKLHQLIDEERFESTWENEDKPEDSVLNMLHWLNDGIHICKTSYGWQTCFDHNWGKYYQPNRKALEEFLSEPSYQIVDEYGDTYTPEEFWEMVDTRNSVVDENGKLINAWVGKTYSEWEKQRDPTWHDYICHDDVNKCISMFNVNPDHNDFAVDGLRFSVFSDFS